MFEDLSSRLSDALRRLTGKESSRGRRRERLREIRRILLGADVSFDLTRQVPRERVQAKPSGRRSSRPSPGQQLVKIVYDELVAMLGEASADRLRVGAAYRHPAGGPLQAEDTTTAGKLARRSERARRIPWWPPTSAAAAVDQLVTLGQQVAWCGVEPGTDSQAVRPSDRPKPTSSRSRDAASKPRASEAGR
jgi:signal recognition particle subunit SRP54